MTLFELFLVVHPILHWMDTMMKSVCLYLGHQTKKGWSHKSAVVMVLIWKGRSKTSETCACQQIGGKQGKLTFSDNVCKRLLALCSLLPMCCRAQSGCICRLKMERWLQSEGRALASAVDAATLLDLLQVHSYGEIHIGFFECWKIKLIEFTLFLRSLWQSSRFFIVC